MSHVLGWSRAFQAERMVCAKALGHFRKYLLCCSEIPCLPSSLFPLLLCLTAHLGKHGKDAPVSRLLSAPGNVSSFLGRVLSRENTGSESRAAQEVGFTRVQEKG